MLPLLEHHIGERPPFDLHGVEDEIRRRWRPPRRSEVRRLPDLRPDRAMTTIDEYRRLRRRATSTTPSSRPISKWRSPSPASCACGTSGGIIITDFIDMKRGNTKAVLASSTGAPARDHTRLTVNGFTALGLVEMTRKRTTESLAHVLCRSA